MNVLRNPQAVLPAAVLAAFLLAGCTSSAATPESGPAEAPAPVSTSTAEGSSSAVANPGAPAAVNADGIPIILRFDDLNGGSSVIQVYPGVTESDADKKFNGTFNDGDTAAASCRAQGRIVNSHPEVGEAERSSDDWVLLAGSAGYYATLTYAELVPTDAVLPECQ